MEVKRRPISEETLFMVYDAALDFLGSFEQKPSIYLEGEEATQEQLGLLETLERCVSRGIEEESGGDPDEVPF